MILDFVYKSTIHIDFLQLESQFQRDEVQQICHSKFFSAQNNPLFKVKKNTHQKLASDEISKIEVDSDLVPNEAT